MKRIVKITIKGSSGYCPIDEAYKDKLTITSSSISYEYTPEIESEINQKRKWSYRTDSPIFATTFEKISSMMPPILYSDEILMAKDSGSIYFSVTYEDKTKDCRKYWCTGDNFFDLFKMIKNLVPAPEFIPAVLLTNDDYSEDKE